MKIKHQLSRIASLFILTTFSITIANATTDTWLANDDGTVTDLATALIWQQQDDGLRRTQANAITYCESLSLAGNTDWRLPNIKELFSIVDHRVDSPAIDERAFLNTVSASYWTSTASANRPDRPLVVFFESGDTFSTLASVLVRCVR